MPPAKQRKGAARSKLGPNTGGAVKKPTTARSTRRNDIDGKHANGSAAGPSDAAKGAANEEVGKDDGPVSAKTSAATATPGPAASRGGVRTRAQRRAQEEAAATAREQDEPETPEAKTRREEEKRIEEEKKEKRRQTKKAQVAQKQKANIPELQSQEDAEAYYARKEKEDAIRAAADEAKAKAAAEENARLAAAEMAQEKAGAVKDTTDAARSEKRLKLDNPTGSSRLSLKVGQRSRDVENERLAKAKDRQDRIDRGESVSSLSSPISILSSTSSSREKERGNNEDNNTTRPSPPQRNYVRPPPRSKRFLCGTEGCSGGAYDFVGLRGHYKSVHKNKGMPKSESDVRTVNFLDWLNDRIDGYPATEQAKVNYAEWLGEFPSNADKENVPPQELSSEGGRKRKRERDQSEAAVAKSKQERESKWKYGHWPDETDAFNKKMRELQDQGKAPLLPVQGHNLVDQSHLNEMQRIQDAQKDANRKVRKVLRNNQLQLEVARQAGDHALLELHNAKEMVRALEQIADDNNVTLPKTDDADEYQKLLLAQAFGEEESEWHAEIQLWDRNLLRRRIYHIYRRQQQAYEEWAAEERRINKWQEPTDMEIDTDAPHNPNELVAEGMVFDKEALPPRAAYATPQNNPDDVVSTSGQDQEAQFGRRLKYTHRRFLREWATIDRILPKKSIRGATAPDSGQNTQNPAGGTAQDRQRDSDQPDTDIQQQDQERTQGSIQPATTGDDSPSRVPEASANAAPGNTQVPPQRWFQQPTMRSETGKWTCVVM